MRTYWLLLVSLFAISLSACKSADQNSSNSITIDLQKQHQIIEGWGTSLAWWANMAGAWPDEKIDEICKWMAIELNMNIYRFNIPGGDNPEHDHFRKDGGNMPGYKASGTHPFNWEADINQQKILKKLCSYRDDEIVEAVSYSPPYWLTNSNCSAGNKNGNENLRPDAYNEFADYLTTVVEYYKENHGIPFRSLAPMNEPNVNWWKYKGNQEGCKFGVESQKKLIKAVYKSLSKKNMLAYCSISASDANSIDACLENVKNYKQNSDVLSLISQVNTHSYHGEKRAELHDFCKNHSKRLWQSESGPLGINTPGIENHLLMAQRIIDDIRLLKVNAWIDWQFMSVDDNWGLITANYDSIRYWKNKNFYVRKQMSAFIKPGYRIVESNNPNAVAAISPDRNELVIVVVNKSDLARNYTVDLGLVSSTIGYRKVFRTTINKDCEQLKKFNSRKPVFKAKFPAKSVTTYVFSLETPEG